MTARPLLFTAWILCAALPRAGAADLAAGRQKAQVCSVCHGQLGLSSAPDAPHLAGHPSIYAAAQMRAYRSGARWHEVMSVVARALSDEDIENLAAWFASLHFDAQSRS